MPARITFPPFISKIARTRKPLYLLTLIAVMGLAIWAKNALAATPSAPATTAMTPALRLAVGTLKLEGTEQAIDAASAAKLLPLWQLLDQLDSSDATAPQEITAVIEEIQLNMTSAQMDTIDAMSISQAKSSGGSTTSAKASVTQVASAASGPMPGGDMFAGGGPMAGGGPIPSGGSRSASTSKASTSAASATVIQQLIQLLETKVQG